MFEVDPPIKQYKKLSVDIFLHLPIDQPLIKGDGLWWTNTVYSVREMVMRPM